MRHHTKDKGDIGLGCVIADLMSHGIQVALPISEHLAFDLIAISDLNKFARVSVKYRAAKEHKISLTFRSSWADKHGVHIRHHSKGEYDATAIYCPDTKQCYYVTNDEVGNEICIRLTQPKNNQKKKVRFASDFCDPNRMFLPP
jgi:hypothetical protein